MIPEVLGVPVHADPQEFLLKLGKEMELSYCRNFWNRAGPAQL